MISGPEWKRTTRIPPQATRMTRREQALTTCYVAVLVWLYAYWCRGMREDTASSSCFRRGDPMGG